MGRRWKGCRGRKATSTDDASSSRMKVWREVGVRKANDASTNPTLSVVVVEKQITDDDGGRVLGQGPPSRHKTRVGRMWGLPARAQNQRAANIYHGVGGVGVNTVAFFPPSLEPVESFPRHGKCRSMVHPGSAASILRIPLSNVFRFGVTDTPLLRGVNLTMRRGESWALVGPQKTALLEVRRNLQQNYKVAKFKRPRRWQGVIGLHRHPRTGFFPF